MFPLPSRAEVSSKANEEVGRQQPEGNALRSGLPRRPLKAGMLRPKAGRDAADIARRQHGQCQYRRDAEVEGQTVDDDIEEVSPYSPLPQCARVKHEEGARQGVERGQNEEEEKGEDQWHSVGALGGRGIVFW